MKIVFLVMQGDEYGDAGVAAVFSSRQLAEAFIEAKKDLPGTPTWALSRVDYTILPYEVDPK